MERDLYNLYHNRKAEDLRKLLSKKHLRIELLRSRRMGWFDLREVAGLINQIKCIKAELANREEQPPEFTE